MSPAGFEALTHIVNETGGRSILPVIRVPTLVVHRSGDQVVWAVQARYAAEHIAGAKYVELPGNDRFPWTGDDAMVDEVEEFLAGARHAVEATACSLPCCSRTSWRRPSTPQRSATAAGARRQSVRRPAPARPVSRA